MWSALPNGLVIVAALAVAAVMTHRRLPFIPVLTNEPMVQAAVAGYGGFAAARIALIAAFLLLAGMPFDPEMAAPAGYLTTLAGMLLLAGFAQATALVLVARSIPGAARRRSAAPLRLAPAFVAAYAVINLVIAQIAWNETGVDYVAADARAATLFNTALLGVPALVLALRPQATAMCGFMTVVYFLALLEAWWFNPLGTKVLYDDQSGFSEALPSWQPHAITVVVVAAALTQLAGVFSLMRRPGETATGRSTAAEV